MFDLKNMISDNIFVYKNFISLDILNNINTEINDLPADSWELMSPSTYYRSKSINSFVPVLEKINTIIPHNMFVNQHLSINRMSKGSTWGEHSDNADFLKSRELSKTLKEGQPYKRTENIVFGLVFYINDFDGGELFYVNKNLKYKPEAGDLVIHGAEDDCRHKVLEVLSDFRYTYSNSISEFIRVPI